MFILDNIKDYTFSVPSFENIKALNSGDLVKLIFRGEDENNDVYVERMWVIITKKTIEDNKIYFEGTLDNDPYYIKDLKYQDVISFSNENIIDIDS